MVITKRGKETKIKGRNVREGEIGRGKERIQKNRNKQTNKKP